jgi:hypothetical protein
LDGSGALRRCARVRPATSGGGQCGRARREQASAGGRW